MDLSEEQTNFASILRLFKIFVKNGWTKHELYESVLTNFSYLLMNLSETQRELMLDLAGKYKWISLNEYSARLTNVLRSIENEKLNSCKRIIVFPIMKPEDQNKIKSSHSIIYMIRGVKPFLDRYNNIEIIELLKYQDIHEDNFQPEENDIIFLVDDYLGSGETIETTLKIVLSNRKIPLEKLNIVTIASQLDTIEVIKNWGIPVYYDYISPKGISDEMEADIANEKIKIMLEIEQIVPGSSLCSLGYNQSEALITLLRTPDNTFPIFWKDHRKKGKKFKAPFPRY